mmetsp:Transcript_8251/g.24800  ORF Transcript_8251/g.24800 Transcript_8251/m.24800 type:complete len:104 (-) Transcript_8251:466-777(-)
MQKRIAQSELRRATARSEQLRADDHDNLGLQQSPIPLRCLALHKRLVRTEQGALRCRRAGSKNDRKLPSTPDDAHHPLQSCAVAGTPARAQKRTCGRRLRVKM